MALAESRPWYRWTWQTWLVSGLVVAALVYRQFEKQTQYGIADGLSYCEVSTFGWPLTHLVMTVNGRTAPTPGFLGLGPPFPPREVYLNWFGLRVAANFLVCIVLTGSTTYVCEAWGRSSKRAQFELRHVLVFTAVLGVLMTLLRSGWAVRYLDLGDGSSLPWSIASWSDFGSPLRWPILWALVCTLFTIVKSADWICSRTVVAIRRQ